MTYKFIITLLVMSIPFTIFSGCKKSKSTPSPSSVPMATYTSAMGGVRNWHGSYYYYHYFNPSVFPGATNIDTFYYYPDTSFAVTVVDDSTIQVFGNTYGHFLTDSVKQIHYFGTAWTYFKYESGRGVAYFYDKDSIAIVKGDKHATNDIYLIKDLRYTF